MDVQRSDVFLRNRIHNRISVSAATKVDFLLIRFELCTLSACQCLSICLTDQTDILYLPRAYDRAWVLQAGTMGDSVALHWKCRRVFCIEKNRRSIADGNHADEAELHVLTRWAGQSPT